MRNIFVAAKSRIINFNIELLKKRLAEADCKDIKNIGAYLAGKPLPYEPVELDAIKQGWRDRINELEAELTEVDAP